MFKLFGKKKSKAHQVYAPTDGKLMPITEVKDDVFSTKMLGDGLAVKSTSGKIYAPVDGTITTVFPTKHAIGITTEEGLEILIHLGLDTVELKGEPFETLVQVGQTVKHGTQLVNMDSAKIQAAGYDDTVIVVYTNMDLLESVSEVKPGDVSHDQEVQEITYK
ncbi:PTS enzyme II, ABC component [Lactobacillus pasteurii DSM 23907 = CRBIP 24.76]|uniref:PTS family glucose porter, IIA component n=1 Tax=Lactobacillus pasteurii DSM 23907 = CRBIP 24.76 TaxID=1423790 RepID=I7KKQ9_9LACO|nr:PTS glucose transporter subunit IIA [Lactobacillus pasteurii]KRK07711.1 PTS enzyme II, ABC component [Lactobacillus pasteurii DSM 23907 = CRBIP 24.76]TDG77720.1 hypothetical protein C5L33_000131 [Lactobacillus pasteurii]CCI84719.1 PTS family glucose porter, IIA component [Lactobacillus pasteurii DSM 23907 = CRBIP 24.76]